MGPNLPSEGVVAAFFDVDNTVIRGASLYQLARALYLRGFIGLGDIMAGLYHQLRYLARGEDASDIAKVRNRALTIIKGRAVAEILAIGEDVYDEILVNRIFPGTKALLDAHRAGGHEVWLVTASPIEIGSLIARRMGATGCLGTVAEHVDGFYTGSLTGDLMHGSAKAVAVRELAERRRIDLDASYAYGDSANDLDMLRAVGNPCGINPDRRLRRYCAQHAWPVRDFRRRRHAVRRSIRAASWAGSLWAVLVASRAIAARVLRRRA